MDRIFRPVIRLMNRLKYKQKFALMAVLTTLMVGGLLTPITIWLVEERNVAHDAEKGLEISRDLSELIYDLQQERGFVQVNETDGEGLEELLETQNTVRERLQEIDEAHSDYIRAFASIDMWLEIQNEIGNLALIEDSAVPDERESFERYTLLLEELIALTQLTIQSTLKSFDGDLDAGIVINDLIDGMLIRAEHAGQIRAYGSFLLGLDAIPEEDRLDLAVRIEEVSHYRYHMVFEHTPEFKMFLDQNRPLQAYYERYEQERDRFQETAYALLAGDYDDREPIDFFRDVTPAVDSHFFVFDEAASYLMNQIEARQRTLVTSQNLIIGFVTGYVMLLLYMFWGFFQSILISVRALRDGSRKVAWGDYDVSVELNTKDEMREVGDAFNHMVMEIDTVMKANESSMIRTKMHQEALLELSTSGFWVEGFLDEALDEITEKVTYATVVDRTSIWLDKKEGLLLSSVYDRESPVPSEGWMADKSRLANMYTWAQNGLFFTMNDVREFRKDHPYIAAYYRSQGIQSALMTVLRSKGAVIGILVFECRKKGRRWHKEEMAFAQSISQLISTALERHELRQKELEIRHMAYFDGLTGLPNRQHFQTLLREQIAFVDEVEMALAVLYVDLDLFKHVNDTWGHSAGDKLLTMVGARMADGVDHRVVISRFGGDEFTMMLSPIQDRKEVATVVEVVQELFRQPFDLDENEVFISCSIGISIYPNNGSTTEDLIKNADMAMYEAKSKGRNAYAFYTEKLYSNMLNRIEMEAELRRAIEHENLTLYYQPQFDLDSGELVGYEALVRWPHHRLGIISPGEFVPLAEETGLILALGDQVIDMAVRQQQRWQSEGYMIVPVSVNVSVKQLMHENIIFTLKRALDDCGIPARSLGIEVTESISAEHFFTIRETLNRIRALGITVSIDDFGTGHSSLGYLKNFPVDFLKIDRTFISGIGTSYEDEAIVRAVIAMAKGLRMQIVAEGVETEEHLDWLRQFSGLKVQGFFMARPGDSEISGKWLSKNADGA